MGQSLNLYVAEPSGRRLSDLYRDAWRAGLKTTYYLRSRGATQNEKSTLDVNRRGIQPRWMRARSASADIGVEESRSREVEERETARRQDGKTASTESDVGRRLSDIEGGSTVGATLASPAALVVTVPIVPASLTATLPARPAILNGESDADEFLCEACQ